MAKFKLTWERDGVAYCEYVDAKDSETAVKKKYGELGEKNIEVRVESLSVRKKKV